MDKSLVENQDDEGEYRVLGRPIRSESHGLRADTYLAGHFPFLSRAAWQKRMREGELLIDGRRQSPGYRLRQGQSLALYHPPSVEPEVSRDIYPIWRKGAIMAVFKPAPLPMHENGPYRKNTFAELLKLEFGPEWAAVHRLDRETSGIVLCGSTYEVRKALSISLADRALRKEYNAIAHGHCQEMRWIEDGPIGDLEQSSIRIKKWVVPGGQSAETQFEVIEQKSDRVLLRAIPRTGRTNQIRIHAAYAGHHLVGDRLFHPDEQVFLEWFVNGLTPTVIERVGHQRCLLHAHAVTFRHPEDGKTYEVSCPLPSDMREYWDSL